MIDSAAAAAIARFFDAPSEPRGRPFARTPSHSRRLGFGEKVHSREIGTMKPAIVPSKSKESRKKVFWGGVSVVVCLGFDIFSEFFRQSGLSASSRWHISIHQKLAFLESPRSYRAFSQE